MARSNRKATKMYPLIELYLSGSLTQKEFSTQHGISTAMLNYWLARYRRETDVSSSFLQIEPSESHTDGPLLEVCYPTGVRLRIFTPVRGEYLDHLLSL